MLPPKLILLWGLVMILVVLCFGCVDYEALSRGSVTLPDGGADLLEVADGDVAVDGAQATDLAKPAPGSSCTLADDGGTGVLSTTGVCLPSACSNGLVMNGFSPPGATTGSPAPSFGSIANLFDGDTCTGWNAGTQNVTLTLTFPTPQTFSQVQVANAATPTTDETYTFYGSVGGNWMQIGSHTYAVGPAGAQAPVSVTAGTYDGLRMAVTGGSFVLIYEVTLGG
jgi:hypothetical protein